MLQLLDVAYAIDTVEPIMKWLSIALVALAVVIGIGVALVKRELLSKYAKRALIVLAVYAGAGCLLLLGLDIQKHYSESYAEENWLNLQALKLQVLLPIAILLVALLVCGVVLAVVSWKKPDGKKKVLLVCGVVCGVALVAAIVLIMNYYLTYIVDDGYYDSDTTTVHNVALYLSAFILIVLAVALAFGFGKGEKKGFDTRSIAYAAVCIAMSFVLSYAKLWEMPQGGSITFASLLPLMLYSYLFGVKKGIFAGFVYGVLQAVQDPWIIHPAQFLLDYPVAFSFIGLAGIFRNAKFAEKLPQLAFGLGAVVAVCFRFISHVLSGVFAFEAYAEGTNPWVYSIAYNSFAFIDLLIVLVAGVLVLSSKSLVKQIQRLNA